MNNGSINRRDFIFQTAALMSAASLTSVTGFGEPASKYKMGLQLFTVRADMAKDATGTLKKVREIGYQDLEIYGYNGDAGTYYNMKSADFKKLLDDTGLTTTSGHYDFAKYFNQPVDALKKYVDQCIVGAKILNQKYITWPWLAPESRSLEHFKELVVKLNMIGEQVTKAGLGFAYHNHDFEFIDHNGQTGYEIVMNETDPKLVKLQIDLYWVMHSSKKSPAELFALQPGRFVMWHIKDMDKVSRDYSELGNGSIDFTKILPDAKKSGLEYYYIEQGGNFQHNPIQSITDSAAFFKKNLEKYLS
jgi:sugar phosphate isomerase/epimerase